MSTAWRLAYNLPPNDPRFLEITEIEIIEDLLVKRYHDEHMHRLLHPAEAEIQELAANPEKGAAVLDRVKQATLANPLFQRALAALGVGGMTKAKPLGEQRLTVRSSTAPRKERTAP